MKVNIYLPHSFEVSYKADVIVGVDYGAYLLSEKKIMMDYAIGDFDSVSQAEFELINKWSKQVIRLNVEKDETDSEAAILFLQKKGYQDITLIGDIGSRSDHFLINYRLVEKYDVTYILKDSKIFSLGKGVHKIKNDYKVFSIFTTSNSEISLSGTKYLLNHQQLTYFDTFTSSNEIIEDYAILEVFSGKVVIVLSQDK